MKKALSVIAGIILLICLAESSQAFCVYTRTSDGTAVQFKQTSGGDFKDDVFPDERGCCNWSNKSCNKGGSRKSYIKMEARVRRVKNGIKYWKAVCEKRFHAGGYMKVYGTRENPDCRAYNVD